MILQANTAQNLQDINPDHLQIIEKSEYFYEIPSISN